MATRKLAKLVGRVVIGSDLTPHDAGLMFEGKIALNTYNRFASRNTIADVLATIERATVDAVEETTDVMPLRFENGTVIEVALTSDAYVSPEAMQLRNRGEAMAVWN